MANEALLWQLMRKHVPGHVCRIESYAGVGQPDVNGCAAGQTWWMELKCLDEFPKRHTTIVKVNHFTPEQRVWILNRVKHGGRVFVFVKVGKDDFYLFDGKDAAENLGVNWVRNGWLFHCIRCWKGRVDWSAFNLIVLGRNVKAKEVE